ncbi:MAG: hypothetical protein LBK60_03805 [Verrucomicrobiales bacterium]|nr:hypothetical protein [Verrucomicrobiales bacterium]
MRRLWVSAVMVSALGWQAAWGAPRLTLKDVTLHSSYPIKRDIVTTYFWIGQGASSYSDTTNYASAWDVKWTRNYGGIDHPEQRTASAQATTLPQKFAPTRNPFYIALPFNDAKYPKLAAKHVPWWNQRLHAANPDRSQCRGRWVMIEFKGRVCFAQWEDVGPLRYDHVRYVFGSERPTKHTKAGLDVSPAVRDYLGLSGLDKTNWRFVDNDEVPYGPWIEYAEQAVVFSAIKSEAKQRAH